MKIIQISDLHFGMNQTEIIEYFLEDLASIKPDVIIISGDLTQRATEEHYQLFQKFLKLLPVAQVLIVPGNHDIPMYNPIERLLYPFSRYKEFVSPQLESSYMNKEVNILGVNSATPYKVKDGRLGERTIKRIKNHFSATDNQLNILFFHHNLNYFSGMHHPLNNAEEFIEYLKESPIHIVCTGHLHYATLKLITKNHQGQCAILHAGSLLCERTKDGKNSYYLIESDQLKCKIEWRVFENNAFSSHQTHEVNF